MLCALAALAACAVLATGAPTPSWPAGERYLVDLGDRDHEGELLAVTPGSLLLREAGGEVELPLSRLHGLAVARPGGHRALAGGMVGLSAGATAALLLNASSRDPLVKAGDVPVIALASGLAGLLVGSRLPASRWVEIEVGSGVPVPVGRRARVHLRDGTLRHGQLLQLDGDRLLLLPPGEGGAVALPRGEVDWLAPLPGEQPSRAGRVAMGAGTGLLLGIGAAVLVEAVDDDTGEGSLGGVEALGRGVLFGLGGLVVGALYGAGNRAPQPGRIELGAQILPLAPGPALALRARF